MEVVGAFSDRVLGTETGLSKAMTTSETMPSGFTSKYPDWPKRVTPFSVHVARARTAPKFEGMSVRIHAPLASGVVARFRTLTTQWSFNCAVAEPAASTTISVSAARNRLDRGPFTIPPSQMQRPKHASHEQPHYTPEEHHGNEAGQRQQDQHEDHVDRPVSDDRREHDGSHEAGCDQRAGRFVRTAKPSRHPDVTRFRRRSDTGDKGELPHTADAQRSVHRRPDGIGDEPSDANDREGGCNPQRRDEGRASVGTGEHIEIERAHP